MYPVVSVAGLVVPVGPLALLLGLYLGSEMSVRATDRLVPAAIAQQWTTSLNQAIYISLIVGLVSGRIGYAWRFYPLYLKTPSLLFSLRPGTLAVLPGVLIAVATGLFILVQRGHIPLWRAVDLAVVGVTTGLVILSAGSFFTGRGYGLPTDVPWGIELWGTARHPAQLYDAGAYALLLALLWWYLPRSLPGEIFWASLAGGGASILVLDAFHATSPTWRSGVRIPQVVALGVLLVALYVLSFYARQHDAGAQSGSDGSRPAEERGVSTK